MLKSPWMLSAVAPIGFLLVAVAALYGPAQSEGAATVFASLAAVAFVLGVLLQSTKRPSVPSLNALSKFADVWLGDNPEATESEARVALTRRFSGATGVPDYQHAFESAAPSGNPGDELAGAGVAGMMASVWFHFFPAAPARPADIEKVLAELQLRS